MKEICSILVCILCFGLHAQQSTKFISGQLKTNDSLNSIPFVSVNNTSIKQGTVTNEEGYFQLPILSFNDTIVVSSFEFEIVKFKVDSITKFYTIYLQPKITKLDAITVRPSNQDPLIDLLIAVRKNEQHATATAKSYFYLRSFQDTFQIELIEGYYNLNYKGYDIDEIHLKAGRLGLTAIENRYFSSHNSVKAITEMTLTKENDLFPLTPLNAKRKNIGQIFQLVIENKFIDEEGDSIWIMNYSTKENYPENFNGKIWLNQTDLIVKKITMNCENCMTHPFNPMFQESDSIANVNLTITKTFKDMKEKGIFEHVDLSYSLDYFSRKGTDHERNYSIATNAVLHVYDYEHQFVLPQFNVANELSDYRKINAFTYNPFFWNNKNEFAMKQEEVKNQCYYSSSTTLTNSDFFKTFNNDTLRNSNLIKKKGIAESQFVHWSKDRIIWRDLKKDSTTNNQMSSIIAERYNLDVQFFLDWNSYNDSIDILTDIIFDPYKSYYYLPIDNRTNCFINMYFDLCEIQRRKLQNELNKLVDRSQKSVFDYYAQFQLTAEKERQRFLQEVDRGTHEQNMEKWNAFIFEQLKINNLQLFLGH